MRVYLQLQKGAKSCAFLNGGIVSSAAAAFQVTDTDAWCAL
jgi:hypothetical protein